MCPKKTKIFSDESFPPLQEAKNADEVDIFGYIKDETGSRTWVYKPSSFVTWDRRFSRALAWDHVTLAFYLPEDKIIEMPKDKLKHSRVTETQRGTKRKLAYIDIEDYLYD